MIELDLLLLVNAGKNPNAHAGSVDCLNGDNSDLDDK